MLIEETPFESGDDEVGALTVEVAEKEVRASALFRQWTGKPKKDQQKPSGRSGEQHFTPEELAPLWGVHANTIRNLFAREADVIRIGRREDEPGRKGRRKYVSMKIPQTVVERVHKKLTAIPYSK